MVGWRCIAVWSLQGGVGKSTLSASLALEAAERRLPTLLTGLGAPDVLPLRLGFKRPEPNLLDWTANPTPEGLRLAVRQYDVLDVLAGFPDQAALDRYLPDAMSPTTGLPALANTAAHAGYAVVVLDVSSPELAAPAIAAANTLLIVTPATPDGLLAAREATRLAHQAMAGRHAVPLSGIHLVLNRVRDSQLGPEEVMRSLAQMLDSPPPLAAVIPDDPRVDVARVQFRPAYAFSEPLRQAARTLGDMLFAPLPATSTATRPAKPARVWRIGPFRIRR
jgi:MinD-like ATPase involved in chromosome partitioning or flagellar assembly